MSSLADRDHDGEAAPSTADIMWPSSGADPLAGGSAGAAAAPFGPEDAAAPFGPEDVAADPMEQFGRWFAQARRAGEPEPEAMNLATVGADGHPSSRFVLLRGIGPHGFVFFTNRTSRKGTEMATSTAVALAWRWALLDRQVRATGTAEPAAEETSDAYFASRARRSQLGAWASPQSEVIADRATLDAAVADAEARFDGATVTRPPWWGGYLVTPDSVELWQGRPNRLHDRVRYRRAGSRWVTERLAP